jgi:hypothetical protein
MSWVAVSSLELYILTIFFLLKCCDEKIKYEDIKAPLDLHFPLLVLHKIEAKEILENYILFISCKAMYTLFEPKYCMKIHYLQFLKIHSILHIFLKDFIMLATDL